MGGSASQGFGRSTSSSDPTVVSPFGTLPYGLAGRNRRQFADPLALGFGFGDPNSRPYQRFAETQLGRAEGPLADYIRQGREFLPSVYGSASDVGRELASRAPGAFDTYMRQAESYLSGLPGLTGAVADARGRAVGDFGAARGDLARARSIVPTDAAGRGIETAERFLREAESPIASNALFQNAYQNASDAAARTAAGSGLIDAGSLQGRRETLSRDLASQFADRLATDRSRALGDFGAAQGVQQANAAILGDLASRGGTLGATEGATVGNLAGLEAELARSGIDVSAGIMPAIQQFGQLLAAGYQVPLEALGNVFAMLSGAQQPGFNLLQATSPVVGQTSESKGLQLSNAVSGGI